MSSPDSRRAGDAAELEQTPSYSDIHQHPNGPPSDVYPADPHHRGDIEPPYTVFRALAPQDVFTVPQQSRPPPKHQHIQQSSHTTQSGLTATLELESDTVEIYDRSNDAFQYSLKGSVELHWSGDAELLLKDARVDFMGYAVMCQ